MRYIITPEQAILAALDTWNPGRLWDIETFFADDDPEYDRGWYYWSYLPGCLPNSDPIGPFASEAEALADARKGLRS